MPILHQLHHLDMAFSTFAESTTPNVHNSLYAHQRTPMRQIIEGLILIAGAMTEE